MKEYILGFSSMLLTAALSVQATSALAVNFAIPSATIPLVGTASPYPINIIVGGLSGPILDVNVGFTGLTHTAISDVGALLRGPGGQTVVLFDGVGGITGVNNVNLVLDDQALSSLPNGGFSSGTFKPTNLVTVPPDVFPSPAPGGPYGSTLSVFNGTNPNGTWSLFINDFSFRLLDAGSLAGGFLQVTIPVPEPAALVLVAVGMLLMSAWLKRKEAHQACVRFAVFSRISRDTPRAKL